MNILFELEKTKDSDCWFCRNEIGETACSIFNSVAPNGEKRFFVCWFGIYNHNRYDKFFKTFDEAKDYIYSKANGMKYKILPNHLITIV